MPQVLGSIPKPCKIQQMNQVWWRMSEIQTLGQQKQEDHEFEASLGYMARFCLKTPDKKQ
jgi:hypothetical protein